MNSGKNLAKGRLAYYNLIKYERKNRKNAQIYLPPQRLP
jgi:hypothetical protein